MIRQTTGTWPVGRITRGKRISTALDQSFQNSNTCGSDPDQPTGQLVVIPSAWQSPTWHCRIDWWKADQELDLWTFSGIWREIHFLCPQFQIKWHKRHHMPDHIGLQFPCWQEALPNNLERKERYMASKVEMMIYDSCTTGLTAIIGQELALTGCWVDSGGVKKPHRFCPDTVALSEISTKSPLSSLSESFSSRGLSRNRSGP